MKYDFKARARLLYDIIYAHDFKKHLYERKKITRF